MDKAQLSRRQFMSTGFALSVIAGCQPKPLTSCQDLSQLTDDEKQVRASLAYADETPLPGRQCDNCQFWVEKIEDELCAGCTILKGPIEPTGYCSSWAPPPANQGS